MRRPSAPLVVTGMLLAACSPGEQQQAVTPGFVDTAQVASQATDTAPAINQSSLLRETFAYEGTTRDPFESLLAAEEVRPMITDLRLVSVIYDPAYPPRSVAVLRDITDGKRYRMRAGDVAGRLRVVQIRPREVVFTVQEFGFERQETLSLRKREETP